MNKNHATIEFDLTNDQAEEIQYLNAQVITAADKGLAHRGMIFAQINHGKVSAKFINAETAGQVIAILKKAGYGDKS